MIVKRSSSKIEEKKNMKKIIGFLNFIHDPAGLWVKLHPIHDQISSLDHLFLIHFDKKKLFHQGLASLANLNY